MLLGFVVTRLFKLPSWVTPAICFNNTTSLPLLLIQSLESTGILKTLLKSDSDTTSEAVKRAKSYFLVCAVVGTSLTFALGPKLLDGEESPDHHQHDQKPSDDQADDQGHDDVEHGHQGNRRVNHQAQPDNSSVNEETSLLPDAVLRRERQYEDAAYAEGKMLWDALPHWMQKFLDFMYAFLNAPIIGAVIGAIIGLVPPLHKAFFAEENEGGLFKAWLTTSIENIGGLFATLQVVVVGVKLSSSLRKMKRGEDSGEVPWIPMLFIIFVRFVLWPV
jgi:predicted permease